MTETEQDNQQQAPLNAPKRATVLVIGGHDPGGGAGIQADIETLSSLGVHSVSLITALTVQNTVSLSGYEPVDAGVILRQFEAIQDDIAIDAVKIGMIGSLEVFAAIMTILDNLPGVPVILDPVLAAGGGGETAGKALREAIVKGLVPRCFLLTPNSIEARRLTEAESIEQCAEKLLESGAENILITGSHDQGDEIIHRWWSPQCELESWSWQRLPGEYHGSGCTLASAIVAFVVRNTPLKMALGLAQAYTYDALKNGFRIGAGQLLPARNSGASSA